MLTLQKIILDNSGRMVSINLNEIESISHNGDGSITHFVMHSGNRYRVSCGIEFTNKVYKAIEKMNNKNAEVMKCVLKEMKAYLSPRNDKPFGNVPDIKS